MTDPTPGRSDQDYEQFLADLRAEVNGTPPDPAPAADDVETGAEPTPAPDTADIADTAVIEPGSEDTAVVEPGTEDTAVISAEPAQRRSIFTGRGRLVTTIVAAAVVLIGAAASAWWFSGHPRGGVAPVAAAPTSRAPHPSRKKAAPTTDNSAYGVGTCITEPVDPSTSGLELKPVPCTGNDAVLMINQVVQQYPECETSADFIDHGFLLTDEAANVTYCLSLVVPTDQCFEFSTNNSQPIQRAACGSAPNVVQVRSIESAASATAACTDQTDPDVWFYNSPTSGQYACVSPQPPGSATSSTLPTAPPELPSGGPSTFPTVPSSTDGVIPE